MKRAARSEAPTVRHAAVFVPSLAAGGAERVAVALARGFALHGVRVDLVLASATGPYVSLISPGVRMVDLAAPRLLSALPGLVRYFRAERPEVVLSVMDPANLLALWARRLSGVSSRVVVSVHSTLSIQARSAPERRQRLIPLLARWSYPAAESIVAVSRGVADDLARLLRIREGRIHVVYNPIVSPEISALAAEPVSHPWFRTGNCPVIVGAGRLAVEKGFDTLIEAFATMLQHRPVRLALLGEGPERARLEQLADALGVRSGIWLSGFVENPYAFMARAAVVALSSRWEGFPTVLVEAMSCGTTVVATDCRSGPDEILESGTYGALVPVGEPDALAKALLAALDKPSDPASLRERASLYSVEASVAAYLRLLFPERE